LASMNLVELEADFPLTGSDGRSTDKPHVGEIIHRMLVDLGVERRSDAPDPYQFEKGFIWERVLSQAAVAAERPGEMELDGILLSPDGVGYDAALGEAVVEEYKCTARSSTLEPTDVVAWMMQTKAYCKAVGTRFCVFRILHLNGDYRSVRTPTPRTWRVEFTQAEVDANWDAIVRYARERGLLQ